MRDDKRIMVLKDQREKSRWLYLKTGNREYLKDMVTLRQMVEIEMSKEARQLAWVLVGMVIVALVAPFVGWFFR